MYNTLQKYVQLPLQYSKAQGDWSKSFWVYARTSNPWRNDRTRLIELTWMPLKVARIESLTNCLQSRELALLISKSIAK